MNSAPPSSQRTHKPNQPAKAKTLELEHRVALAPLNTLGIAVQAKNLVRIRSDACVRQALALPKLGAGPKFVLGGGSNIVLNKNLNTLVLKAEVTGKRLAQESADFWLVEAGAGESWHGLVQWTLAQAWPGLENLALIPGTVGAAPVQNIGAYGRELSDFLHSLDAVDLVTGCSITLDKRACRLGYRDSIFKQALAGKTLITRVRLALPKNWQPVIGYHDIARAHLDSGIAKPNAQQIFSWICAIRRAKLPDPKVLGNVGSFFKNPTVTPHQCEDIIARDPHVVHYPMPSGDFKLAAGWLIDACGWRGKNIGHAGVYDKQALVLVNLGSATGAEISTLAQAIQVSVYERFGIRLEPEPTWVK